MAGFGLPQVGDFHARTQQAMAGAQGAAGGMLDKYRLDSANALAAQEMAMAREQMALDEAYRRDQLEYNMMNSDRTFDANQPSAGDRLLGGLGGAFTGYMLGSAMGGEGGSAMWGYGGAALGALGGLL